MVVNEGENPAHLNSRYMRELTHGNFIIKQDQIALLDHIGQGTYLNTDNSSRILNFMLGKFWGEEYIYYLPRCIYHELQV